MTNPDNPNIINFDLWKQAAGGRHQIGTLAGFRSEQVAGFLLECMAGFVGIRSLVYEDELLWIEIELSGEPFPASLQHVRALLLGRVRALFLNVMP